MHALVALAVGKYLVHVLYGFITVWADNADNCAKQYAGTGALKTDFTRFIVFNSCIYTEK